eukprot:14074861-Ditylum_brightwellii.AAC.1
MARNGKITQHGKKSDGKTLWKNKTITPTANVVTTTTLEEIAPKRSSNTHIIRQEKTQSLHPTPNDNTCFILSNDSDSITNSGDVSHVGNSNKNQVSINNTSKVQEMPENMDI